MVTDLFAHGRGMVVNVSAHGIGIAHGGVRDDHLLIKENGHGHILMQVGW